MTAFEPIIVMGSLELGLVFAIMTMGVFISFRILNTPDLTVDGSIVLGIAVSAVFTKMGMPLLGIILSFIVGMLAGSVTGLLITNVKIQPILAGILTMTALYSVNYRIFGTPNISLFDYDTIFTPFKDFLPKEWLNIIVIGVIVAIIAVLLYLFLKTQIGISLRATGDNEFMVRATSISSEKMKILGLALANGLVALSGGIWAQQKTSGDINDGIGIMVMSLASIIIGEVIFRKRSVVSGILAAISGAIIFRYVYSLALASLSDIGMKTSDLKIMTAAIVVIIIFVRKVGIKKHFVALSNKVGGNKNA